MDRSDRPQLLVLGTGHRRASPGLSFSDRCRSAAPGDLAFRGDGWAVYVEIATSILLSVAAHRGAGSCDLAAAIAKEKPRWQKTDQNRRPQRRPRSRRKILNALQAVLDPEIGLSVIDLDLIAKVQFTPEEAEIRWSDDAVLPLRPMLINQIQSVSETAAEMPVKVTSYPIAGSRRPGCAEL